MNNIRRRRQSLTRDKPAMHASLFLRPGSDEPDLILQPLSLPPSTHTRFRCISLQHPAYPHMGAVDQLRTFDGSPYTSGATLLGFSSFTRPVSWIS